MEGHKFNTQIQKEGESFQSFVADLRILANTCEYGTLKDELIRDNFACGVCSRLVKKQFLKEQDLALNCGTDIGIANKLSEKNTKLSNQVSDHGIMEEVHGVDKGLSKKDSKPGIENCRICGNHAPSRNYVQRLHCRKPSHLEKTLVDSISNLPRRRSKGLSRVPPHEHLFNRPVTSIRWHLCFERTNPLLCFKCCHLSFAMGLFIV